MEVKVTLEAGQSLIDLVNTAAGLVPADDHSSYSARKKDQEAAKV